MKCPGQDSRYWKPGAIFEALCPECGAGVEFFKDDNLHLNNKGYQVWTSLLRPIIKETLKQEKKNR